MSFLLDVLGFVLVVTIVATILRYKRRHSSLNVRSRTVGNAGVSTASFEVIRILRLAGRYIRARSQFASDEGRRDSARDYTLQLFLMKVCDRTTDQLVSAYWARRVLKGHKGFLLTKDEVDGGITAAQFLAGLDINKVEDGEGMGPWVWDNEKYVRCRGFGEVPGAKGSVGDGAKEKDSGVKAKDVEKGTEGLVVKREQLEDVVLPAVAPAVKVAKAGAAATATAPSKTGSTAPAKSTKASASASAGVATKPTTTTAATAATLPGKVPASGGTKADQALAVVRTNTTTATATAGRVRMADSTSSVSANGGAPAKTNGKKWVREDGDEGAGRKSGKEGKKRVEVERERESEFKYEHERKWSDDDGGGGFSIGHRTLDDRITIFAFIRSHIVIEAQTAQATGWVWWSPSSTIDFDYVVDHVITGVGLLVNPMFRVA
ncbi:hypothetical protein DFP72DRAFT_855470 [Ephemerocybe angulata]|uniref:Uncharacterized protein n=1 Tax=Ephemerocybe angulata TaxID=980116 RepID=A0A8H6HIM1_9AGAR|nr:hypothetical protein DFP72DRAFT_855470 [Tulosesus angulatus]